jgi:TatD DNase family protein
MIEDSTTTAGVPRCAWVDIGANLTHESFAIDRERVIQGARAAGVTRQVVTGADLVSSRAAAALARDFPGQLWSTAGIHPHHAALFERGQLAALRELLGERRTVAVGECGLDYFRNFSPAGAQRTAFLAQLELAAELQKPLFLHQRDAHADFCALLGEFRGRLPRAVAHCFTGGIEELEDYLALGLSIGVTGWVCDERRGGALRSAVPRIPAERLMLETDAPYLLPRDLDPPPGTRRNEPRFLPHIGATVARLRGESPDELARNTTRNACAFFGLEEPG